MTNQIELSAPEGSTRRWILALTSAAALLVGLDALIVSTAITTIRTDLGASPAGLQWLVNAYTIAFAVLLLPASALGDRFGRRRIFTAGLLLFASASRGRALAGDTATLSRPERSRAPEPPA